MIEGIPLGLMVKPVILRVGRKKADPRRVQTGNGQLLQDRGETGVGIDIKGSGFCFLAYDRDRLFDYFPGKKRLPSHPWPKRIASS